MEVDEIYKFSDPRDVEMAIRCCRAFKRRRQLDEYAVQRAEEYVKVRGPGCICGRHGWRKVWGFACFGFCGALPLTFVYPKGLKWVRVFRNGEWFIWAKTLSYWRMVYMGENPISWFGFEP